MYYSIYCSVIVRMLPAIGGLSGALFVQLNYRVTLLRSR